MRSGRSKVDAGKSRDTALRERPIRKNIAATATPTTALQKQNSKREGRDTWITKKRKSSRHLTVEKL